MSYYENWIGADETLLISEIDQKIISMYAKGMTTRQISDTLIDYSSMFISSLIFFDTELFITVANFRKSLALITARP